MAAKCAILISSAALLMLGFLPIKDPLNQQPVQNSVNVPHPRSSISHPVSSLHPDKPDEIAEVEVVSLVVIPVFPLAVHPLNQRVCSGIWASIHGCAVGRVSVCHTRHTSDGALAVATWHVVAVKVVMRHDE